MPALNGNRDVRPSKRSMRSKGVPMSKAPGVPALSRRRLLGSGAAAVGVLSSFGAAASAEQRQGSGGTQNPRPAPDARRWIKAVPTRTSTRGAAQPALLLCAFDYEDLTRVVASDRELLLAFETSRAFITVRIKCAEGRVEALSNAVLRAETLDLRDTAVLGIQDVKISDYLEWESLLPPLKPRG